MTQRRWSAVARWAMAVAVAGVLLAGSAVLTEQAAGRQPAVKKRAPDIVLREYEPRSMLVTEQHLVQRAKFPAIDNHNHLRGADPEAAVKAMDAAGVVQVVNLDGGFGETLRRSIERFEKRFPGRFVTYALPDWSRVNDADFGQKAAAQLEADVKAGARGLKIHKNLGLTLKDGAGRRIPVDDPRLDPLWAKCGELRIPVEMHIGDPAAFFTPLDKFNERYDELQDHLNWLFYPGFPPLEDIIREGERVVARHPKTTIIGAHMGWHAENLSAVGAMLDKYPNYYVDIDARISELGRQPYTARRFMIKYQDRILFGTDTEPDAEAYRVYFRFLETEDEYFDVARSHHLQGRWMAYGVHLPDEVLRKLYYGNALKLIPGTSIGSK